MNKKEIENKNLMIPTPSSSLNVSSKNINNILNPNTLNISLAEETSVSSSDKTSKEEELLLNKENFSKLNSEEMDIDESSTNNNNNTEVSKNPKTNGNSDNNNNEHLLTLMKMNNENLINNKKSLLTHQMSSPLSPLINNLPSENQNKVNMDFSYLFDFSGINPSLLKDENNSSNKSITNILQPKSLTPEAECFPLINKELSIMNNHNNFGFKN